MNTQNSQALLNIFNACAQTLYPVFENLSAAQLNWRPAPESRSIGLITRHLIRVDKWFLDRLDITHSIADPGEVGSNELLAALQNTHKQIAGVLKNIRDDAELTRKSTSPDANPHETFAEVLVHMAQHYLYHFAQIVYLRRAQDREWKAPLKLWENASYVLSDELAAIKHLFSK